MKELFNFIGISPKRLRLEWIAISEGNKFAQAVSDFTEEDSQLGPSPLRFKKKGKFAIHHTGQDLERLDP